MLRRARFLRGLLLALFAAAVALPSQSLQSTDGSVNPPALLPSLDMQQGTRGLFRDSSSLIPL